MTARFTVLLRLEASPQIGLGHFQRCLSLAIALQRLGANCVFLTNTEPIVQKRVSDCGFEAEVLDGSEPGSTGDLSAVMEAATRHAGEVIVVDSYRAGADYLRGLREAGLSVVAIDDLAAHTFPCHIVVNGSAGARELPYVATEKDTRLLLGPEYILLRPEFWAIPPRRSREAVENILVTLGGADSHNLTPKLVAMLDGFALHFGVAVVVGPFFENRDEIVTAASRCRRPVRLVEAPESVCDLMLEADLAISAGGQTLYELAAAGTPTVAIQVADNQSTNLRGLEAQGTIRFAGSVEDVDLVERVEEAVRALMSNRNERELMCQAGQRLVDGKGSVRLAGEIAALRF